MTATWAGAKLGNDRGDRCGTGTTLSSFTVLYSGRLFAFELCDSQTSAIEHVSESVGAAEHWAEVRWGTMCWPSWGVQSVDSAGMGDGERER